MNFRVYVTLEIPILDKEYELLVPVDRRVHDLIAVLKNNMPELSENYYKDKVPSLYNKISGEMYDMNQIIKDSNIKTGTRLLLI